MSELPVGTAGWDVVRVEHKFELSGRTLSQRNLSVTFYSNASGAKLKSTRGPVGGPRTGLAGTYLARHLQAQARRV